MNDERDEGIYSLADRDSMRHDHVMPQMGRQRFNKVGLWLAAVLAAALTAALAGVLTGVFDALGRAVTGMGSSTKSAPTPSPRTSEADPLTISVEPLMHPCGEDWVVP